LSRYSLKIIGMSCASCSAGLEKSIGRLNGVENVSVNLLLQKLIVDLDDSKISLDDIKKEIKNQGFDYDVYVRNDNNDKKESNVFLLKLVTSLIFAMLLLFISMGHMIEPLKKYIPSFLHPNDYQLNYALTSFLLTIPIIISGYKFYVVGFKKIFKKVPNMDSLIAVSTSSAIIYSLFSLYQIIIGKVEYVNHLYFETAGVIIALILLGKYLENLAKKRTQDSIKKLLQLKPKTAIILKDNKEIEVLVDDILINDVILVKPGNIIAVDGIVVEGKTEIDESMLTGESMPITKSIGDIVYSGTTNLNGMIKFKVEKIGEDTTLSKIIKLIENAANKKAPISKIADIVSGYFVTVIFVIAIVTFLLWFLVSGSLSFALTIFISILVIACPCALGLATPTAIMVSIGRAAKSGILIKSGEALEVIHKVNTIIFDKTGTITKGKPEVTDFYSINDKNKLLQLLGSAEKGSEHILGQAIVKYIENLNIDILDLSSFESITGKGIKAIVDNKKVIVGNKKIMEENNIDFKILEENYINLSKQGKTVMYIAIDNVIEGVIAVSDNVKDTSKEAIEELSNLGIECLMITGDNNASANYIANQVGIDKVISEVMPEDKLNEVLKNKENKKIVAMVGDGINDAPAMQAADVGIAVSSGTDVTLESADIILINNDIRDILSLIKISKTTIRNIKQNLFWAFFYNVIGIVIATGILYIFGGPLLNPIFAAAAMSFSSISVLLNALRLKYIKLYR
jgi:P-type Cu+ transporter